MTISNEPTGRVAPRDLKISLRIRRAGIVVLITGVISTAAALAAPPPPAEATAVTPALVVYKSPACGCCTKWAEHMRHAGFTVTLVDTTDLDAIKQRSGVPRAQGSCHTATVGGYVVEGHVPPSDVTRLLKERPNARGLTVPGMPVDSPGMDGPSARGFDVLLIHHDGTTSVFAHHGHDATHGH